MSLTATITPGKTFAVDEALDNAKLNQLGQPTVLIEGTLQGLDDVSATDPTVTGQPFVWNSGTSKWEPGTVAAAYLGVMTGATALAVGTKGAAPAPGAGDYEKFLRGDATWQPAPQSAGSVLAQWSACF